jgi:hypothetical protein
MVHPIRDPEAGLLSLSFLCCSTLVSIPCHCGYERKIEENFHSVFPVRFTFWDLIYQQYPLKVKQLSTTLTLAGFQ